MLHMAHDAMIHTGQREVSSRSSHVKTLDHGTDLVAYPGLDLGCLSASPLRLWMRLLA